MKVSEAFPKPWIRPTDLADGEVWVVTIAGIKRNEYTVKEGDRYGTPGDLEVSYRLYFRETQKYLKIKENKAVAISQLLGDEEMENWIGREIGLIKVAKEQGGSRQVYVDVDKILPGRRGGASLVDRRVTGRIGEAAGQRFLSACTEAGVRFDDFLAWCKKNQPDALPLVFGVEVADIPGSCAKVMGEFLKQAHTKSLPGQQQTSGAAGDDQRHPEEVVARRVATPSAIRTAIGRTDQVPAGVGVGGGDEVIDDKDIPF